MGFNLADYEPVEDRLRQFWTEHPYGRVITELLEHGGGEYIVHASVYIGNELRNDPPSATGLAHDSTESLPANMKSSALEVCETSAIGRALANLGYAPKGKRPSREEMSKTKTWGEPVPAKPTAAGVIPSPAAVEEERAGVDGEAAPVLSNTSSGEPVDGKPESEGALSGDSASSDDLLNQCYVKFGNGPKLLKAARAFFDHDPPNSIADLTEGQMEMLLLEVAKT